MTQTLSFAKAGLKVQAKVFDQMPMTLHSEIGTGTAPDGRTVVMKQPVTNDAVFIQIGDKVYQVGFYDLVAACLDSEKKTSSTALVKSQVDAEAVGLAHGLKEHVVARYPHYQSTLNEAKIAKQIHLLHKQDERFTYDLIAKVMRWLFEQYQPKGNFDWREQVRSGDKFRKHFPAILDLIRKELSESQMETI